MEGMRLHRLIMVAACALVACSDAGGDGAAGDAGPPGQPRDGGAPVAHGGAPDAQDGQLAAGAGELACPTPPDPPTLDPLCQRFNDQLCPRLVECAPRYYSHDRHTTPRTEEGCQQVLSRRCQVPGLPGSTLTAASYDACLARLLGGSCALVRTAAPVGMGVCTEPGTLEPGSPCQQGDQCTEGVCRSGNCSGLRSDGDGGILPPESFALVRDEGEAPAAGEQSCRNEFLALSDGRCERTGGGVGEPCLCDTLTGLWCMCGDVPCDCESRRGISGPCPPEGVCGPPPLLSQGDVCGTHPKDIYSVPGMCEEGTRCGSSSQGMGVCFVPGVSGERCYADFRGQQQGSCGAGLVCVTEAQEPEDGISPVPGVCTECVSPP